MKRSENTTANLIALGFVATVAVVFMSFVISPVLGFGILATAGFLAII
jgi:hypothetical protein